MPKPIVVVGSINLDLVVGADRLPQPGETITGNSFATFHGGKGANQAVAAAKLGYPVAMVGNVGRDAFGSQLRNGLESAGVDTEHVRSVEGPSGIALITTGKQGENNIVVVPGANALLTPEMIQNASATLERAGILLAQLEIPLETVEYLAQFAEQHNIPLMLDPAPARELPATLVRRVSWITPNETEARVLLATSAENSTDHSDEALGRVADRFLDRGVNNVILRLGSRGCLIAQSVLPELRVPAFPVAAVDTTAAGDAFNAGFAVALMRGSEVSSSAVFASAVAAISVTRFGAQPSMPTADEVDSFLKANSAHITLTKRKSEGDSLDRVV
jgi:ribokinase